ncbi:hypothetical protein FA95DRAFT_1126820 [Auriscalpium vulgare]|uniref:Uncharacterized protein n=1 Tax=Auriscalpium vulgare TaxID=40419 RepID=A0ACB8RVM7_9AGAM|nr:hypothetical protein FA95DRAFT_1126820 [Auriscalpium vulgare]
MAKKIYSEPTSDTSPVKTSPVKKKPRSKALERVSISSLADLTVPAKPLSKPALKNRFQSPTPTPAAAPAAEADDDAASVAESSRTVNRRTEEDRIAFFRAQSACGDVEPHRAFCNSCETWVPLNATRRYVMRPWTVHSRQCKSASASAKPESKASPRKADDDESDAEDDQSNIQSTSDKSVRKSEAERQAYFEADPRAEEVRPFEVLCKTCHKWIKLGTTRRFALKNWKAHQNRCSGSISRVATAERKLKLVNDKAAKSYTTKSVQCAHCKDSVALEGEGDYNLTKWDEHKANCAKAPRVKERVVTLGAPSEGISSPEHSPRRAEKSADRPPSSVASTEATAVAVEAPRQGTKRAREDDDDEAADDVQPPRVRARKEGPSGALGWLLLPFKSFINGFKEGLQGSESST